MLLVIITAAAEAKTSATQITKATTVFWRWERDVPGSCREQVTNKHNNKSRLTPWFLPLARTSRHATRCAASAMAGRVPRLVRQLPPPLIAPREYQAIPHEILIPMETAGEWISVGGAALVVIGIVIAG